MSLAYKIWIIERILRGAKCRKCSHRSRGVKAPQDRWFCSIWDKWVSSTSNCAYYHS